MRKIRYELVALGLAMFAGCKSSNCLCSQRRQRRPRHPSRAST